MKLSCIIALFALIVTVKSAWWVGLTKPIVLGFGAVFAALDIDLQPVADVQPLEWGKKLLTANKYKEKAPAIAKDQDEEEDVDEQEQVGFMKLTPE